MIIILLKIVIGIGVGPAVTNIDFEPNLTSTYGIDIYNTEGREFNTLLTITGELKEFINLNSQIIFFNASDKQKRIFFDLALPRNISPGFYKSKLNIITQPTNNEGTIVASVGVSHDIKLTVPTHGKYIKEFIERFDKFILLTIKNIGLQTISEVNIVSTITDSNNTYVEQFTTSNFQPDNLYLANISLDLPPGEYIRNISIHYDDLIKEVLNRITIGSIELSILDLNVAKFQKGQIISAKIFAESNWNEELEVYFEVDVVSDQVLTTATSQTITLKNTGSTTIFIDNVKEGEYTFVVKLYYNNNLYSEEKFEIQLQEKITTKKQILFRTIILLAIILSLLAILITIIRKHEKRF